MNAPTTYEPCSADLLVEAGLFRALGDPNRAAILAILARRDHPVCVRELTACVSVRQPTVSHHLEYLRRLRLVARMRRGAMVGYVLAPGARELIVAAYAAVLQDGLAGEAKRA